MTMLSALRDTIRKLRRSERTLVLMRGRVRSGDMDLPVDIVDVSESGARLYASTSPAVDGDPLTLLWGNREQRARIVWRDGKHYGIKFDEPLPGVVILDMLTAAQKLAG
jgi:hypothetical protein